MSRFSPSEAAFEGFRLTREKPSLILSIGLLEILYALIGGAIFFSMAGQQFLDVLSAAMAHDSARLQNIQAQMMPIRIAQLATAPVQLLVYSVMFAAIFRGVLRPTDRGLGYLKLGGDELRLLLLGVVFFLLMLLFAVAVGIVIGILSVAAQTAPEQARGPLVSLIVVLALTLSLWVAVRLSLAGPMTFAEGKLRIFESWRLTRGHFWSLLGMYLLTIILAVVVSVLIMVVLAVIGVVLALALGIGDVIKTLSAGGHVDFAGLAPGLLIGAAVFLLLASFFNAFVRIVTYAPAAVAYRELSSK
jgi:hypothetical protein